VKPEFWQALLGAELAPLRARKAAEAYRALLLPPEPKDWLLSQPWMSPANRKRLDEIDPAALARALRAGAQVRETEGLSEALDAAEVTPAIFFRGEVECLSRPTIAIVGTRAASSYGKAVASKFAEAFARAGVTVVSGGAIGIDAAAHRSALAAGGKTVAVLAGGIDRIYPAVHAGLFEEIARNGCLVSQFAAGARPNPYKFLVRNGLIAALSLGVVLVECPKRSGALNTAHHANDLGRQVFVVPGPIEQPGFAGSHALIRDGATLVDDPDQVLEALHLQASPPPEPVPVDGAGLKILQNLTTDCVAVEVLVERTGLPPDEVLAELTMLELDGLVSKEPGGFRRRL
jgi:DNA processing protein